MENSDLLELARGLEVTDTGIVILEEVWNSEPARRVRASSRGKTGLCGTQVKKWGLLFKLKAIHWSFQGCC